MKPPTPAQLAREQAGYSLAQVARYCRTSEAAIQRLESAGRGWGYLRAERLAQLYHCPLECFPGPSVGKRLRKNHRDVREAP